MKPTNNVEGGKKEKKKVKFPCKLCLEDHMTYKFPLIDQAQKLLKQQQPDVLEDPFAQGKNATSSSKYIGGTSSSPSTNQYYINMVWSHTLLKTRAKNYETKGQ